MRFLADESCDFGIVRALRGAGHNVLAVAEISPRAEDPEIVDLAVNEGRLLLTRTKILGGWFSLTEEPRGELFCCASRPGLAAMLPTLSFPSSKTRERN